MARIEDIKLHVSASVDGVQRAVSGMHAAITQLDEAIARLQIVTAGSVHPRAVDAVHRLAQARERLFEAETLARSGVDAAQDYHGII